MDSGESDNETEGPPTAKTRKLDGAAKYHTKFNAEWTRKWLCIIRASGGTAYKFTCTICQCSVSCEYQGEKDVRRHIEGKKHCDNVKGLKTRNPICS